MSKAKPIDLGLKHVDELFMDDAERAELKLPRIHDIPLDQIDDFPDHPFKVREDEDMEQLVQSVRERGIMCPTSSRTPHPRAQKPLTLFGIVRQLCF